MSRTPLSVLALSLLFLVPLAAQAPADPKLLEREILKELIEVNTSDSAGHTGQTAEALAKRLRDAGFPAADVQILHPTDRQGMLVARLRGSAGTVKPILLMAHLDVVDARKEDWSFDPYVFREQDGFYYGRGANDNKAGAAMLVANFIRYKREGFVPRRDLIVVLTSDEETDGGSITYVLREHRDLVDAEYALNTDGGGGELRNGKPTTFSVQAAEKVYADFQFEIRNRGGHSSLPVPDNAIYRLSRVLDRLSTYTFPVRLTEVTRAYFDRSARSQPAQIAADMRALAKTGSPAAAARLSKEPYYNSVMRTTCVATRLYGGHANNALPQLAQANVNCRLHPDDSPDSVIATLRRIAGDTAVHVTKLRGGGSGTATPPSPLRPELMAPVEELAGRMWPTAAVVPEMSTGATDGFYTRTAGIPTYGVAALFEEVGDSRAHGRDERVGVKAYHDAAAFWYQLVKTLASGPGGV